MTDEEIDYSDIPPLSEEQLARMRPLGEVLPHLVQMREQIVVALESDIAEWVQEKAQHSAQEYKIIVNRALRVYIEQEKEPLEETLRRIIREELQATG